MTSPHTQAPLLNKGDRAAGGSHHQHPPLCYIVTIDLINLIMTAAEIALVLYLTIHHIQESRGVIAVAMIAPILLNFVGVNYFFSDKRERRLFDKIGTTRLTKDLFQVPVMGPVFTAFKVLLISTGLSKRQDVQYERFEAAAVKMRQAQTFFSASPEAVVQLSVLLISQDSSITLDHILEILIVVISVFTLAESNVYALRSYYFRLFHNWIDGEWEVHETFWRKCILFLHSFSSIGSRIAASACLIAAVQCYVMRESAARVASMMNAMMSTMSATKITTTTPVPKFPNLNDRRRPLSPTTTATPRLPWAWPARPGMMQPMTPEAEMSQATQQLAMMIALTYIGLIIYHMITSYVGRLLRYAIMRKNAQGGCYESINYGWRATILHTGFQSKNVATQIWFYVENCAMFALWWFSVQYLGNPRMKENTHIPMTVAFALSTVLSVFFLFAAVGCRMHKLESPFVYRQRISTAIQY